MAKFKFIGDTPKVYVDVQLADQTTLLAVPDETYELLVDPKDLLLEAVVKSVAKAVDTTPESPVTPAN